MLAHPYRVFLSHVRRDKKIAKRLARHLEELGALPLREGAARPARPVDANTRERIAVAHLFVLVTTEKSRASQRVHQELGHALGSGVPVLALAVGAARKAAVSAGLHTIVLRKHLEDLHERLAPALLDELVADPRSRRSASYEVAERSGKRAFLLVRHAQDALRLEPRGGRVRIRSPFSSFSLPADAHSDAYWRLREGSEQRNSEEDRELLRQERQVLESHARLQGFDLILDPEAQRASAGATIVRLRALVEFLVRVGDCGGRVAFEPDIASSTTIVGDWFLCEAVPSAASRSPRALFTRHAPSVLEACRSFDRLLARRLEAAGTSGEQSCQVAIARLTRRIAQIAGRAAGAGHGPSG